MSIFKPKGYSRAAPVPTWGWGGANLHAHTHREHVRA